MNWRDISYTPGKHLFLEFELTDPNTGAPIDVSAWNGTASLLDGIGGTVLFTATLEIVDGGLGQARFTFAPAATGAMPSEVGFYTCDFVDGASKTYRAQEGLLFPEP